MPGWFRAGYQRALLSGASILLLAGWGVGQFVRDRTLNFALLFYIPSPVVAMFLLLAAAACRWSGGRRQASGLLCLSLFPLWMVLCVENQWGTPFKPAAAVRPDAADNRRNAAVPRTANHAAASDIHQQNASSGVQPIVSEQSLSSKTLRLVHWNVGWPDRVWPSQRSVLRELDPDLCVLSEATAVITELDFPGFEILRKHNMLIACRGSMTSTGRQVPGGIVEAFVVTCHIEPASLKVALVDVASPPRLPRNPGLKLMLDAAQNRGADLIVGDMNTPRRSLALSSLPDGFRHAYDAAGAGWSYTWPVPVPVLAIDQCMCGPRITPLKYQLKSTTLSDHRLQILDFQFHPDAVPTVASPDNRPPNVSH